MFPSDSDDPTRFHFCWNLFFNRQHMCEIQKYIIIMTLFLYCYAWESLGSPRNQYWTQTPIAGLGLNLDSEIAGPGLDPD